MPKSKRNKTVDLSKTKKHGLEGKKQLYQKIQSNIENYAYVFVLAVNDMRNSKMKNVREQWKHSRFCIGKNKVMAMALGRTPEEEYRPNLHKVSQMLIGERGLLFTNQSLDEVTNWFENYSAGDYARSGNIATEDVILPEGPLPQFAHNLESYLRQLGLPTTLKKGVIHLVKEHVVCTEGDRLSPETARILKLLGYEMAEFRIKILSVWSQNGNFLNLQSGSCDPESKENVSNNQKSFMKEDFELAKDCLSLGDDSDIEIDENNSTDENKISNKPEIEDENATENLEDVTEKNDGDRKSLEGNVSRNLAENPEISKVNSKGKKTKETEKTQTDVNETSDLEENVMHQSKSPVKNSSPTKQLETEDVEMEVEEIEEPKMKKLKNDSTAKKSGKKLKKNVNKQIVEETDEQASEVILDQKVSSKKEKVDASAILKLTEKKLEESAEKPKKFSPKMTRARAAATNKKVKTPEPLEIKRSARKRKM